MSKLSNVEVVQAKAEYIVQGLADKDGRVKATNASASSMVRSWFHENSPGGLPHGVPSQRAECFLLPIRVRYITNGCRKGTGSFPVSS